MYWGAADELKADAEDPKRRVRRLTVAVAVVVLSIGGSVAMASASTTHSSASPAVPAAPLSLVDSSHIEKPVQTVPPSDTAPSTSTTVPPPSTTVPPPSTTVARRPAAAVHAAAAVPARPAAAPVVRTATAATTVNAADTCGAAIAYLSAHSAPGFHFECPGYALGHQAMTCVDMAGVCPGSKLIVISVVCPASYMNEAHNSWIIAGLTTGVIDPYGYCH